MYNKITYSSEIPGGIKAHPELAFIQSSQVLFFTKWLLEKDLYGKYFVPLKQKPEGFHEIRNQLVPSKLNTTHETNACSKLTIKVPSEIN